MGSKGIMELDTSGLLGGKVAREKFIEASKTADSLDRMQ
jgi:hypothetical protein